MSDGHPGSILPEDITGQDAWDDVVTALHVTDDEVDELLYGEDRPVNERITRLKEIAEQLHTYEPGDLGGDTRALLGQIDEAIDRLSGGLERDPELDGEPTLSNDPLDHRELLSPDSDELEEIEEEDEESLSDDEGPLPDDETDQTAWDDEQTGFDEKKP
jgi:hypothetical protein